MKSLELEVSFSRRLASYWSAFCEALRGSRGPGLRVRLVWGAFPNPLALAAVSTRFTTAAKWDAGTSHFKALV